MNIDFETMAVLEEESQNVSPLFSCISFVMFYFCAFLYYSRNEYHVNHIPCYINLVYLNVLDTNKRILIKNDDNYLLFACSNRGPNIAQ